MDIKEYISTGILESYLLDELTPKERLEVERHLSDYPALREELRLAEETLEAFARKGAVSPRPEVKRSIMATIGESSKDAKVIPISLGRWKLAAAASVAIALVASYMAFNYRERWVQSESALRDLVAQNQQVAKDYNSVNQKLDKIQSDLAIIESTAFEKVVMKGTANDLNAMASVYWNPVTHESYLSIQNLKEISRENQYQLWAIVKGRPVDVGVFDKGFIGLIKMKNIEGAAAFAVTVEQRGGKDTPTLENMQVIGALSRSKS